MWKPIAYSLLLLALSACSSLFGGDPEVVNPTPPGVSYRVDNNNPAATDQEARESCGRFGEKAKRENATKASDSTIIQYSCN